VIRLRDTVTIAVRPETVWHWFENLSRHYRAWHPAHLDCRHVRGDRLAAGAVIQMDEEVHVRRHSLTLRADRVVPGRLLRYSASGLRGAFILEPAGAGTRFTAEMEVGSRLPVVGRLLDAVLRRLLARQLSAIAPHVREEGVNLKRLLEWQARAPVGG
jgi:hypothetical protein